MAHEASVVARDVCDVKESNRRGFFATSRMGLDYDCTIALNSDGRATGTKEFGRTKGYKGLKAVFIVIYVRVGAYVKNETVIERVYRSILAKGGSLGFARHSIDGAN